MRTTVLALFSLILSITVSCAENTRFWEQMSETEKSCFLETQTVDGTLISLYNGSFEIGDNEETFKSLKLLSTNNYDASHTDATSDAFYFHCFSKILNRSDGALSEVMGQYCWRIVNVSPRYSMAYMKSHNDIKDKFVEFIGYEFLFLDNLESAYKDLMDTMSSDSAFAEEFVSAIKIFVQEHQE